MKQEQVKGRLTVFFSYAQADQVWHEQLAKHLSQLKRDGLIEGWSHQQILPGVDRAKEIDQALRSAHIILLLISADFLASDAQYQIEMQHALERHKRGEVRVVPVIVRPCDWQHSPFAHLQCLPPNAKPITSWDNLDEAFDAIVKALRKIIELQQFPNPLLSSLQRQNRVKLLKRVDTAWIKGLLEDSLHRAALIDLHLQEQPDMLENPWRFQVQELGHPPRALPVGTSVVEVYDEADGELLILGEPGSGKTTLLLQLAQTLINRALTDERHHMPVVFNLSSWTKKREALAKWLVEELEIKYQIPRRIGLHWIETSQVIPLLDGLDEVDEKARVACVKAIIAYYSRQQSRASTSMVVCCRTEEYQTLSPYLSLQRAISILPLMSEQIDNYLSGSQGKLEVLQQALHKDVTLYELVHRPLMLNIFTLAYQESNAAELSTELTQTQNLHVIFGKYVKHMLLRRGQLQPWKQKEFLHWLCFLAKQMHQKQQTVFLREELHPSWLPDKQPHLYAWVFILVFGLFFGTFGGLLVGILGGLLGKFFVGLVIGILGGLITGTFGGSQIFMGSEKMSLEGELIDSSITNVVIFLALGLLVGLVLWLTLWSVVGLVCGLIGGFGCGLFGIYGRQWSKGISLFSNDGIQRSMKSGLFSGLLAGLVTGVLGWLIFGLIFGSIDGLVLGSTLGLVIGLLSGLFFGLDAFVHYFTLHLWLWRINCLPWKLNSFLDEAVERILMRKVGGLYFRASDFARLPLYNRRIYTR